MSLPVWKEPLSLDGELLQPANTLSEALRRCAEHASRERRLSMPRLADRLGVGHWTLYKWIQTGRMPVNMLRPFEDACGISLGTRWLASSAQYLLVRMPTGQGVTDEAFHGLQEYLLSALHELLRFYRGRTDSGRAGRAVHRALEALAFHLRNIRGHIQPQLPFGGAA